MKKVILGLFLAITAFLTVGCYEEEDFGSKNITMYTRDTSSGTRDAFMSSIGLSDASSSDDYLNTAFATVSSNGDMISSIKNDEYGIGYISLTSLASSGVFLCLCPSVCLPVRLFAFLLLILMKTFPDF